MLKLSICTLAAVSCLALSGCASLTGFSNAKTDFSCSDSSGKPSCRNISEVYAESSAPVVVTHSSDTVFPVDTQDNKPLQPFFEPNREAAGAQASSGKTVTAEQAVASEEDKIARKETARNRSDFAVISPATPWRKPETIFRVWMAPFTDADGDLHDQRYMYVKVVEAGWSTPTVDELAKPRSSFRPVYPLNQASNTEEAPKKKSSVLDVLRQKS